MNIPITIKDDVRPDISCCVKDWINKAASWSQSRYDFVDFEKDVVITVEALPKDKAGEGALFQPQHYPYRIRVFEVDHVWWKVEAVEKYWLRSGYFYTGPEIAYQTAMVGLFTGVTYALGPESYREKWDRLWTPQIEIYEFLNQNYPDLLNSWIDRSNWLTDHVSKIPSTHWQFPPTPKGLCRISGGGHSPGMVYPPGCER